MILGANNSGKMLYCLRFLARFTAITTAKKKWNKLLIMFHCTKFDLCVGILIRLGRVFWLF